MSKRCVLLRDHPHPSHILCLVPDDHPIWSPTLATIGGGELLKMQLVRVTDKVVVYREVVEPPPQEPICPLPNVS